MKKFNFLLFFLFSLSLYAQRKINDSIISTPWVAIHYGVNWAQNDLAQRFGFINHLGVHAGYKTTKNWVWAFDGSFMFGEKAKSAGIFDELKDSNGNLTDINGDIATVLTNMRGFNTNVALGKVLPVGSKNRNSGIYIHVGAGYLLHKINIESRDQVIPLLELKYKRGYDRLTTGLNLHQFIGYAFLAHKGVVNFYGGFYFQEGFTKNFRAIFFDQPSTPVPTATRIDVQVGLKTGWFIPIYKRKPKEFYFN